MFKDLDEVMATVRSLTQDQLSQVVIGAAALLVTGDITDDQFEFVTSTVLAVMVERELAEGATVN